MQNFSFTNKMTRRRIIDKNSARLITLPYGFNFANNYEDLDGIIVHTAHPEFLEIDFSLNPALKFLYDGRNMFSHLKYLQNKFTYFNI